MIKWPSKLVWVSAVLALVSFAVAFESGDGVFTAFGALFLTIGLIDYSVGSPSKKAPPTFSKG